MLVLSGIRQLTDRIQREEQLAHFLRPTSFREIHIHQQNCLDELNSFVMPMLNELVMISLKLGPLISTEGSVSHAEVAGDSWLNC